MRSRPVHAVAAITVTVTALVCCGGGDGGAGRDGERIDAAAGGSGGNGGPVGSGGAQVGSGGAGQGGTSATGGSIRPGAFRISGSVRLPAGPAAVGLLGGPVLLDTIDAIDAGAPFDAPFGEDGDTADAGITDQPDGADSTDATERRRITHVMAVNPSSQSFAQMLTEIDDAGRFQLDLDPKIPWILVFIDSARVGAEMIAGVFKAADLDTIAPMGQGTADLGAVDIASGRATISLSYDQLLTALGLDPSAAHTLGAVDDLCLRYVNPDVDGDGVIDALQTDRRFMLDLHARMNMTPAGGGMNVTVADIIDAFLPDNTVPSYTGTGIYVSYPTTFATPTVDSMWASFDEPISYSSPTGTKTAGAGSIIPGTDLVTLGYGGSGTASEGIETVAQYDMPQGTYRFGVAEKTMTFTNIQTHTAAELTAADNLFAPFLRIRRADGCTGDCTLSAVDYVWKKHTATGWVDSTLDELRLLVDDQGGVLSIFKQHDNGTQRALWRIPATAVSGALDWSAAMLENLDAPGLASMTVSQICHVGISYDDKLGTRFFSTVRNAPGTCPEQ